MDGRKDERLPHRQRPENGEARDQEPEVDGEVQQRPPHVRLEALPGHGGRQLAQTRHVALPEGTFKLKFLWLEKNIGFAVDQVVPGAPPRRPRRADAIPVQRLRGGGRCTGSTGPAAGGGAGSGPCHRPSAP